MNYLLVVQVFVRTPPNTTAALVIGDALWLRNAAIQEKHPKSRYSTEKTLSRAMTRRSWSPGSNAAKPWVL